MKVRMFIFFMLIFGQKFYACEESKSADQISMAINEDIFKMLFEPAWFDSLEKYEKFVEDLVANDRDGKYRETERVVGRESFVDPSTGCCFVDPETGFSKHHPVLRNVYGHLVDMSGKPFVKEGQKSIEAYAYVLFLLKPKNFVVKEAARSIHDRIQTLGMHEAISRMAPKSEKNVMRKLQARSLGLK